MEAYRSDFIGCFIWELQETSQRHTNGISWIHTTETSWWGTTETSFGVSFETYLRWHGDVPMGRPLTTSSRHTNKTSRRRTTETSWRLSTETLWGVSFETYLWRRWDAPREVVTTSPRRLVVRWKPSSDSDDNVPLSSLQFPKADKEWKWRKQFKRSYVEKCVFAEDGIVNIEVQDLSPMQVFAKTVGLEGLLSCWKSNRRDSLSKMEECFRPRWKNCVRFLK